MKTGNKPKSSLGSPDPSITSLVGEESSVAPAAHNIVTSKGDGLEFSVTPSAPDFTSSNGSKPSVALSVAPRPSKLRSSSERRSTSGKRSLSLNRPSGDTQVTAAQSKKTESVEGDFSSEKWIKNSFTWEQLPQRESGKKSQAVESLDSSPIVTSVVEVEKSTPKTVRVNFKSKFLSTPLGGLSTTPKKLSTAPNGEPVATPSRDSSNDRLQIDEGSATVAEVASAKSHATPVPSPKKDQDTTLAPESTVEERSSPVTRSMSNQQKLLSGVQVNAGTKVHVVADTPMETSSKKKKNKNKSSKKRKGQPNDEESAEPVEREEATPVVDPDIMDVDPQEILIEGMFPINKPAHTVQRESSVTLEDINPTEEVDTPVLPLTERQFEWSDLYDPEGFERTGVRLESHLNYCRQAEDILKKDPNRFNDRVRQKVLRAKDVLVMYRQLLLRKAKEEASVQVQQKSSSKRKILKKGQEDSKDALNCEVTETHKLEERINECPKTPDKVPHKSPPYVLCGVDLSIDNLDWAAAAEQSNALLTGAIQQEVEEALASTSRPVEINTTDEDSDDEPMLIATGQATGKPDGPPSGHSSDSSEGSGNEDSKDGAVSSRNGSEAEEGEGEEDTNPTAPDQSNDQGDDLPEDQPLEGNADDQGGDDPNDKNNRDSDRKDDDSKRDLDEENDEEEEDESEASYQPPSDQDEPDVIELTSYGEFSRPTLKLAEEVGIDRKGYFVSKGSLYFAPDAEEALSFAGHGTIEWPNLPAKYESYDFGFVLPKEWINNTNAASQWRCFAIDQWRWLKPFQRQFITLPGSLYVHPGRACLLFTVLRLFSYMATINHFYQRSRTECLDEPESTDDAGTSDKLYGLSPDEMDIGITQQALTTTGSWDTLEEMCEDETFLLIQSLLEKRNELAQKATEENYVIKDTDFPTTLDEILNAFATSDYQTMKDMSLEDAAETDLSLLLYQLVCIRDTEAHICLKDVVDPSVPVLPFPVSPKYANVVRDIHEGCFEAYTHFSVLVPKDQLKATYHQYYGYPTREDQPVVPDTVNHRREVDKDLTLYLPNGAVQLLYVELSQLSELTTAYNDLKKLFIQLMGRYEKCISAIDHAAKSRSDHFKGAPRKYSILCILTAVLKYTSDNLLVTLANLRVVLMGAYHGFTDTMSLKEWTNARNYMQKSLAIEAPIYDALAKILCIKYKLVSMTRLDEPKDDTVNFEKEMTQMYPHFTREENGCLYGNDHPFSYLKCVPVPLDTLMYLTNTITFAKRLTEDGKEPMILVSVKADNKEVLSLPFNGVNWERNQVTNFVDVTDVIVPTLTKDPHKGVTITSEEGICPLVTLGSEQAKDHFKTAIEAASESDQEKDGKYKGYKFFVFTLNESVCLCTEQEAMDAMSMTNAQMLPNMGEALNKPPEPEAKFQDKADDRKPPKSSIKAPVKQSTPAQDALRVLQKLRKKGADEVIQHFKYSKGVAPIQGYEIPVTEVPGHALPAVRLNCYRESLSKRVFVLGKTLRGKIEQTMLEDEDENIIHLQRRNKRLKELKGDTPYWATFCKVLSSAEAFGTETNPGHQKSVVPVRLLCKNYNVALHHPLSNHFDEDPCTALADIEARIDSLQRCGRFLATEISFAYDEIVKPTIKVRDLSRIRYDKAPAFRTVPLNIRGDCYSTPVKDQRPNSCSLLKEYQALRGDHPLKKDKEARSMYLFLVAFEEYLKRLRENFDSVPGMYIRKFEIGYEQDKLYLQLHVNALADAREKLFEIYQNGPPMPGAKERVLKDVLFSAESVEGLVQRHSFFSGWVFYPSVAIIPYRLRRIEIALLGAPFEVLHAQAMLSCAPVFPCQLDNGVFWPIDWERPGFINEFRDDTDYALSAVNTLVGQPLRPWPRKPVREFENLDEDLDKFTALYGPRLGSFTTTMTTCQAMRSCFYNRRARLAPQTVKLQEDAAKEKTKIVYDKSRPRQASESKEPEDEPRAEIILTRNTFTVGDYFTKSQREGLLKQSEKSCAHIYPCEAARDQRRYPVSLVDSATGIEPFPDLDYQNPHRTTILIPQMKLELPAISNLRNVTFDNVMRNAHLSPEMACLRADCPSSKVIRSFTCGPENWFKHFHSPITRDLILYGAFESSGTNADATYHALISWIEHIINASKFCCRRLKVQNHSVGLAGYLSVLYVDMEYGLATGTVVNPRPGLCFATVVVEQLRLRGEMLRIGQKEMPMTYGNLDRVVKDLTKRTNKSLTLYSPKDLATIVFMLFGYGIAYGEIHTEFHTIQLPSETKKGLYGLKPGYPVPLSIQWKGFCTKYVRPDFILGIVQVHERTRSKFLLPRTATYKDATQRVPVVGVTDGDLCPFFMAGLPDWNQETEPLVSMLQYIEGRVSRSFLLDSERFNNRVKLIRHDADLVKLFKEVPPVANSDITIQTT